LTFSTKTGAYVDLKSIKMVAKSSSAALKSDAVFEFIIDQVKADPNKAKSVGGVFLYKITKDGKEVKQWSKYYVQEKMHKCVSLRKINSFMVCDWSKTN